MMKRTMPIVAALLLLTATPALADWGASRWGMTLDQVLDAVPGARPLKREGTGSDVWKQQRLASAPWQDGKIDAIADFFFDPETHTLTLVKTLPNDVGQCTAFQDTLIARYGAGKREEQSFDNGLTIMGIRWTDPKTGERLLYSRLDATNGPARYCHFIQQAPA